MFSDDFTYRFLKPNQGVDIHGVETHHPLPGPTTKEHSHLSTFAKGVLYPSSLYTKEQDGELFFFSFALALVSFPNIRVLFLVPSDVKSVLQNSMLIVFPFRRIRGLTSLKWAPLSVALALFLCSVGK